MLKKLADSISRVINENYQLSKKDDAYLNFGLQLWLNLLVEIIVLLIIAYFTGIFWSVLTAIISFLIIRKYAGGIHMPTFISCLIVTLIIFLAIGGITSVIQINQIFLLITIFFISFSGFILINKYAPADTKTIPITDPEQRKFFKIKAKRILAIWTVLAITASLIFKNHLNLILASGLGIFSQLVSTHPFFFYIIENFFPEHD